MSWLIKRTSRGDTIIEVMIALAIATFAIGSAYAIASRALNQAISARERNDALNILESQVSALKLRNVLDPDNFDPTFAVKNKQFCLDETATSPSARTWKPQNNFNTANLATNLVVGTPPSSTEPYDLPCARDDTGHVAASAGQEKYFVNIDTQTQNGLIVYQFNVRWQNLGGGPANQAQIYYRVK